MTSTDTACRERRAAVTVEQDDDWVMVTIGDHRVRLTPSEAWILSDDCRIASQAASEVRWANVEKGKVYGDGE